MGIIKDLWRREANDWPLRAVGQTREITAYKRYVSVLLRRLCIADSRVGFSRFYGAVEFYGRIPHLSGQPAEFASVTSPGKLHDVTKRDLDNFALGTQRLLGPVPYVGGDLDIEIGLFAIKSQDLLQPYLDLLGELSRSAGLAYFAVTAPYVAAIQTGAAALMRPEGSSSLEIGTMVTFDHVEEGTYFAARLNPDDQDLASFSVDDRGYLCDGKQRRITGVPYLVFSVTQTGVRDDWHQIPAIAVAYGKLMSAVRDQRSNNEVASYFEHFRRVVLTDPDLLGGHGRQVAAWVHAQVAEARGATLTSRRVTGPALPALSALQLSPL